MRLSLDALQLRLRCCSTPAIAFAPSLPPPHPIPQRNSSPLALVSSAPEQRVLPALEQAGLTSRFDAIVTADDVYRGKPDPEGYLYAAQVGALLLRPLSRGRARTVHTADGAPVPECCRIGPVLAGESSRCPLRSTLPHPRPRPIL